MKILLTGATGFLGSHLIPQLRDRGHRVGCLLRSSSVLQQDLADLPAWRVEANGAGFREALTEFMPDVVVHLAALYVAEHRYEDVGPLVQANVAFGTYLLDAMQSVGCKAMVYAGTSWQHYRDRAYCPANLYAATKQAFSTMAEYYLDTVGLRLLELHLYDSYGDDDRRNRLVNLLQGSTESTEVLHMSGGEQRAYLVHIDDVAWGFAMACMQVMNFSPGERRVYRLPSEEAVSLKQVVCTFNAVDPTKPAHVNWGEKAYRHREIFQPWENAETLPGWRAKVGLMEGLRRVRSVVRSSKQ
jgi:nucleoside-diphosphate-sugar epimerase